MDFDDLVVQASTESPFLDESGRFTNVEALQGEVSEPSTQEGRSEQSESHFQEEQAEQSKPITQNKRKNKQKKQLKPLSSEEQRDFVRLELAIERKSSEVHDKLGQAHYEWGQLLAEVRTRELYRFTHGKNFNRYCQDRYGYTRRHGDNLIQFVIVIDNLQMGTDRSQNQLDENSSKIFANHLPNLEQAKPLFGLTSEQQREVWNKIKEAVADGKDISGRLVGEIVEKYKQENNIFVEGNKKSLNLADCQEGDIFIVDSLKGEEKKYNSCWAIVTKVTDSEINVDVQNTTITVHLKNLKRIPSSADKQEMSTLSTRMKRLVKVELLEPGAKVFLENVSKRTNFSDLDERMFSCMEEYYMVTEKESKL
ncbi:hypothetical protein B7486_47830 [cyanobacterium TDX16]|nr:hypothetical protein B7486_47830 [cyanobacterium TDX16]